VLNKPGKKFVILGKTRWQSDRHKKWMQHLGKVTEAQALEEWGKEALGTAAHITTTSTLAIMNVGYDEEQKSRVQIASLLLLEGANLFAAVLNARRRKPISPEPALKIKVGRKIYELYMVANAPKRRLQNRRNPQNKFFRRRFGVPFSMFRSIEIESG
jgi:hypothetical protein